MNSLGSTDLPAVGTTIGLDRVVDVIIDQNLWPESAKSTAQVFVSIFDPSFEQYSLKIASELREQGINTETYLNSKEKLSNQLKYADRKNIPYAIIAGSNEAEKQEVVLKNLKTGEQITCGIAEIGENISSR
jgi:histidyl-tRNA synthetase